MLKETHMTFDMLFFYMTPSLYNKIQYLYSNNAFKSTS